MSVHAAAMPKHMPAMQVVSTSSTDRVYTGVWQRGQLSFSSSHRLMHEAWKECLQGRLRTPLCMLPKQMQQSSILLVLRDMPASRLERVHSVLEERHAASY